MRSAGSLFNRNGVGAKYVRNRIWRSPDSMFRLARNDGDFVRCCRTEGRRNFRHKVGVLVFFLEWELLCRPTLWEGAYERIQWMLHSDWEQVGLPRITQTVQWTVWGIKRVYVAGTGEENSECLCSQKHTVSIATKPNTCRVRVEMRCVLRTELPENAP